MSTIEERIIRAREREYVTIDEIMRAVVESQDMALAWYRKEEDSYGTLNNQYLVIGELIAAALADARREGAEAMRGAAAGVCDLNHFHCIERRESETGDSEDQYQAEMAKECAQEIRALPRPTGERQAVLLTDEQIDSLRMQTGYAAGIERFSIIAHDIEGVVLAANNLEVRRG